MDRDVENPMVIDSLWIDYEKTNHDDDEDYNAEYDEDAVIGVGFWRVYNDYWL